jgi:hypothetical protein
MFAPGREFLAVTLGATRVLPRGRLPRTRGPAGFAAAAAQRVNANDSLEPFTDALATGNASVTRAAFGTFQLHPVEPGSIIDRIAADFEVVLHARRKRLSQTVAHRASSWNTDAFDARCRE